MKRSQPSRLAVLAIYPVQYQIPIWSMLGKHPSIDLTVYYLQEPFKGWEMPLMDGYSYKFLRNLGPHAGEGFTRAINPGVIAEIAREKYDAVLIHGYETASMWLGLLTAKLTGTLVIMRGESVLTKPRANWLKRAKDLVLPRVFDLCDIVLYSCTGNRQYYEHYGVPDHKLLLIPVAVDNSRFQAESQQWAEHASSLRTEFNIPQDHLVVLNPAQLCPWKRSIDLLRALKSLQDWGVDGVSAVFIGEGVERARMQAYIDEHHLSNAHLLGFQDHRTIGKFYALADVGVIISEFDNSPKALNEMMNFRLPIICTNTVGSAPDLAHEGENGFIIEVGDVEALAKHLKALVENRDLVRQMGDKSLDIVSQWSIESNVEAIVNALRKIM